MESSIKYVQSEGWRSGPTKSVLARMGEGGSAVKCKYVSFFQGSLQNRNEIKWAIQVAKIIHSHLPRTVKKRKLAISLAQLKSANSVPGLFLVTDSFAQWFLYFVMFFEILWLIVIRKIYLGHYLKNIIRTLGVREMGCRLNAYVHVQGRRGI